MIVSAILCRVLQSKMEQFKAIVQKQSVLCSNVMRIERVHSSQPPHEAYAAEPSW